MMEIEVMINDLEKIYAKEKSIKKKVMLESAISCLKRYEKESRDM